MLKDMYSKATRWALLFFFSIIVAIGFIYLCIDAILEGEYIMIFVLLLFIVLLFVGFVYSWSYPFFPKDSNFFCGKPYDFAYTIAERGQKLYFQIIHGQNKNNSEIEVSLLAVEDADVQKDQVRQHVALMIPSSVTLRDKTYFVREIEQYALFWNSGFHSVIIPNTVTRIGDYAFPKHTSLSSIIVEEGNPVYDSRDNCNAIIHTKSNKLVAICQNTVIPDSVVGWRDGCFEEEAVGTFRLIYKDKDSFRYHYLKGLLHLSIDNVSKKIGAAVAEFEKCLEIEPENTEILTTLGFCYSYYFLPIYDYDKSLKYYTKAMNLLSKEQDKNHIQFSIDQLNAYNKGEYDDVLWIGVQFWDDRLN